MLLYKIIKSIMYAELLEHICIIYGCECVKHCMHTRSPGPQNQQCYSCWVCVQIFWDLCSDQLLGDGAKVNFILTILPSIQHLRLLPSLLSQFQLPSSLYKPQLKSKPEEIDGNDLVEICLLLRTMLCFNNLALSCSNRQSVTGKSWQALSGQRVEVMMQWCNSQVCDAFGKVSNLAREEVPLIDGEQVV